MFIDQDIQVLGALETYLHNRDAQDLLDTLKMIFMNYSKYINIDHIEEQLKNYQSRRNSQEQNVSSQINQALQVEKLPQINHEQTDSKQIIYRFRMYFTAEQKLKLEEIASKGDESIQCLFQQYQLDSDLNGFIQAMQGLTSPDSPQRRASYEMPKDQIEIVLEQLTNEGLLTIDEYLLDQICINKQDPKIKGLFEFYKYQQDKEELVESLRSLAKIMQRNCITALIDELANEFNWAKEKVYTDQYLNILQKQSGKLKDLANKDTPVLIGAFSVYFMCPEKDKETEKLELLDTLNRLV